MESILTSIKKLLGITEDYEAFDLDVIAAINSAFMTLNQIGVGTSKPFSIKDKTTVWSDFTNIEDYEAMKSYIYLKTRLLFDPPQSSSVIDAMERMASEYEWRLNIAVEVLKDDDQEIEVKNQNE